MESILDPTSDGVTMCSEPSSTIPDGHPDPGPVESIVAASSLSSNLARRRCFDEAFPSGSESESITPEPDEHPVEGASDMSRCSSSTDGSSKTSSEAMGIICEAHPGCLKSFTNVREYEEHYNLRHRHKCITCRKSLPSAHILELHVLEAHDTLFSLMAERKPMLACFLESCTTTFWKPGERKEHCLSEHKFPKSFKLWDLSAPSGGKKSESKPNGKGKTANKPNQKEKTKNQSKSTPTTKESSEQMQTDSSQPSSNGVSSTSDVPALEQSETMEIETPVTTQETLSTKSKSKTNQSEKGNKNRPKSVPVQITFGHSASRVFNPKYTFGLSKPASEEGVSSTSSKMDLDMSDIKDVLPTTTTTPSTTAME